MDLRPVTFEYNDDVGMPGVRYGFIAEEVQQIDDLLVGYDEDGLVHSVRHLSIIPLMTQAIQELKNQVDTLQLLVDGGGVAGLSLSAPLQVSQLTVGEIIALDGEKVTFNNDVVVLGRPYFNADTGGFAEIKQGDREVVVTFDQEYAAEPVVNVTLAADENDEEEIFDADIRYLVIEKEVTGFTIKLNRNAPEDLMFNWIALAIKNPRTVSSVSEVIDGLTLPDDNNDNNGGGGDNSTPEPPAEEPPVEEPELPQPEADPVPDDPAGAAPPAEAEEPPIEDPAPEEEQPPPAEAEEPPPADNPTEETP